MNEGISDLVHLERIRTNQQLMKQNLKERHKIHIAMSKGRRFEIFGKLANVKPASASGRPTIESN